IGSYGGGKTLREEANNPAVAETQTLRIQPKGPKGDVVLYLAALELVAGDGTILWQRPRFVSGAKPPLFLKDYAQFGPRFEVDLRAVFAATAEYLAAAVDRDPKALDATWLKRWTEVLALETKVAQTVDLEKMSPVAPLELLDVQNPKNEKHPAIRGWRSKA